VIGSGPRSEPVEGRSSRVPNLTTQILAGLLLGIVVGALWPRVGVATKPIADAFLRLIKMIIAPLLFSTLVVGIAGAGDLKVMGRIAVKAIVYRGGHDDCARHRPRAVNILPGAGRRAARRRCICACHHGSGPPNRVGHVSASVPTSVVDAMARGDILQVVVFSMFFGGRCGYGHARQARRRGADSLAHVMFKVTAHAMAFALLGVSRRLRRRWVAEVCRSSCRWESSWRSCTAGSPCSC
jgi:proton glutamate symport protein